MISEYRNPLMITRTWHIKRTQAAKIARIGNDLGISHNALVRKMLDYALQAIDDGALVLRTRPSRYELIDDG